MTAMWTAATDAMGMRGQAECTSFSRTLWSVLFTVFLNKNYSVAVVGSVSHARLHWTNTIQSSVHVDS